MAAAAAYFEEIGSGSKFLKRQVKYPRCAKEDFIVDLFTMICDGSVGEGCPLCDTDVFRNS